MHGVLFRSSNEARKKAKNLAENDYYDSDEDTFFDRTGQIEKNREKRRLRALVSHVITFLRTGSPDVDLDFNGGFSLT